MWVAVEGFSNYEVSDEGFVRNAKGRVLSPRPNHDGYSRAMLTSHSGKRDYKMHRLVAAHFIPNPDNLPEVNHIDGVKSNNHHTNLEWVTHGENMRHAMKAGLVRVTRGDERVGSKLTNAKVSDILQRLAVGERPTDLAEEYGVSTVMISRIKHNKVYQHVGR